MSVPAVRSVEEVRDDAERNRLTWVESDRAAERSAVVIAVAVVVASAAAWLAVTLADWIP